MHPLLSATNSNVFAIQLNQGVNVAISILFFVLHNQ